MTQEEMLALLAELIACHSPPGEEREVDSVIRREFEASGAEVWQDDATNVYAHLAGTGLKVMVCAHKDEIGMLVTKVRDEGRLEVEACGGSSPWKYGEGPVDVITDEGTTLRGILSVGSTHATTGPVAELVRDRALTWDLVTIFTGASQAELDQRGVHVGSRVVVARERKQVQNLGPYIASFGLDDRMGLVNLISGLKYIRQRAELVSGEGLDLYFVATSGEEIGMLGGVRAAQLLQPDLCVALDTAPVAQGSPLVVDARPVVWYRETTYHDKPECDVLLALANDLGFGAQPGINPRAGMDSAAVKEMGLAGRTVSFGPARDNSHGFEIAHIESLVNVTRLLVAYLEQLEMR